MAVAEAVSTRETYGVDGSGVEANRTTHRFCVPSFQTFGFQPIWMRAQAELPDWATPERTVLPGGGRNVVVTNNNMIDLRGILQ